MRARLAGWSKILLATLPLGLPAAHAQDPPRPGLLVYAAASLTDVLGELSTAWQRRSGITVRSSFASSAVLARQIEAGARADVFIPADQDWMDYLEARQRLDVTTRRDLVGNRLVLIAPSDSRVRLRIAPGFDLAAALAGGRLSTADPATVPAGRYARAALESLGVWSAVEHRLARADNVRGALMFVARGEAPLGIVYATDARVDRNVRIVDTFPADSHAPITYPAAVLAGARSESVEFVRFLAGAEARAIWKRHGFVELD